jgi:DNA repair protein RadD
LVGDGSGGAEKMITLYPDQVELVDNTRNALRTNKSVLMQAATGAGKTVVIAYMFEAAAIKKRRSMMVVPRQELLSQTSNTFTEFGLKHSFVSAGHKYDPAAPSFIATSGTLVNRLDDAPDVDFLAIDETHYGSTALDKIIQHYKSKGTYIIGASATPCKTSGKGLGCWYDSMVQGKPVAWLIKNKRLSDYLIFGVDSPDLSGIKTTAGDYNRGQLAERMENDRILVGNVAAHYKQHALGKLNITFATSRDHARMLNQSFLGIGIPSAYVDGNTPHDERRKIFLSLARREILNVCNCELLTFGFDVASAAGMDVTIESISVARPTQSDALWRQICGRAMRYKDYPAFIFDHSGNHKRLGFPDDDHAWTLADQKRRTAKQQSEAELKIRQCPKCYLSHRPAPVCAYCGHVYPVKPREIETVDGELTQLKRGGFSGEGISVPMDVVEERNCRTREDWERLAVKRGYKSPTVWAEIRLAAREKRKPNYGIAMSRRKLFA